MSDKQKRSSPQIRWDVFADKNGFPRVVVQHGPALTAECIIEGMNFGPRRLP